MKIKTGALFLMMFFIVCLSGCGRKSALLPVSKEVTISRITVKAEEDQIVFNVVTGLQKRDIQGIKLIRKSWLKGLEQSSENAKTETVSRTGYDSQQPVTLLDNNVAKGMGYEYHVCAFTINAGREKVENQLAVFKVIEFDGIKSEMTRIK